MIISGLDYLAFTQKWNAGRLPILASDTWADGTPRNGYTAAQRSKLGVVEMTHHEREDMGVHTVISGSVLNALEFSGIDPMNILKDALNAGATIARIDVRVDIVDVDFDISELVEAYNKRDVVTKVRSGTNVQSLSDAGHTLYIGSMKKRKKLMRVYDKYGQDKLAAISERHKRVELEVHGKAATAMALDLSRSEHIGATIAGCIKGFCDFPSIPSWKAVFGNASAIEYGSFTREPSDNTRKWLIEACAPALARICTDDSGFMTEFMNAVMSTLRDNAVVK